MDKNLKTLFISGLAMVSMSFATAALSAESKLWAQFKKAKEDVTEPTLPDFSYAGYDYSDKPIPDTSHWKVFNVRDYAASPNDNVFDDAGIQAAIDAAEAHTAGVDPSDLSVGAIVQFEAGQYRLAPLQGLHPEQTITIQGNNILIKGKGSKSSNGTVLFIENHMARDKYCGNDGGTNHCVGIPMFEVSPATSPTGVGSALVGTIERETHTLSVEDGSKFYPGQRVIVFLRGSNDLTTAEFDGHALDQRWSRIIDGMAVREFHTVKSVSGNKVTLRAPVHITVKDTYKDNSGKGANLVNTASVENVGFENIQFKGNWASINEEFIHHKGSSRNEVDDPIHDYGWTGLHLTRVYNGWINRVEFKDLNQSLFINESSAVTVANTKFTGKKGHASIHLLNSTSVLVKDSKDTAGHQHGIGASSRNAGGVYLRYQMSGDQHIDFHGIGPYATLHDTISGGHFNGSGSGTNSRPHHMNYYVAWNFEVDGGFDTLDFWPTGPSNSHTFLDPYFIGVHGKNVTFKSSTVGANESQGTPVEPGSLFEAQVGLRHLPGYTYLGTEGGEKHFSTPVDIAYGVDGKYNIKYNLQGTVQLNNSTFGDAVPGMKKVVYYRTAAPEDYIYAAKEKETVSVPGLRNVAFGAQGQYKILTNVVDDIECTRQAFGVDPIPGVVKACYVKVINAPDGYDFATNERGAITVTQPVDVTYGAAGKYIFLDNVTSNITCNNSAFGDDPKPGVAKKCYTRVVEAASLSNSSSSN